MTDSTFEDIQAICDVLTKAKAQRCTEIDVEFPIIVIGKKDGTIRIRAKWEKRRD